MASFTPDIPTVFHFSCFDKPEPSLYHQMRLCLFSPAASIQLRLKLLPHLLHSVFFYCWTWCIRNLTPQMRGVKVLIGYMTEKILFNEYGSE